MLGAIIGDIVGSRFEWKNCKKKDFPFFGKYCYATDDSMMSIAIAKAILSSKEDFSDLYEQTVKYMQEIGRKYPDRGYGGMFAEWIMEETPKPYNSYGNGAAMRISPVGFCARNEEEVKTLSQIVTGTTHNHPEGIKGAEATAMCIFYARQGKTLDQIKQMVIESYYPLDFCLDEIRDTYVFNETCQNTVPQALMAFFESTGYEDAIRNAISIGGDSDTIAAICGGIAEAYYGIPSSIKEEGFTYLDAFQKEIVVSFEEKYPSK